MILSYILAVIVAVLFVVVMWLLWNLSLTVDQIRVLHRREQALWYEFMRHTHSNHVPAATDVSDESVELHTDRLMWWMARPGK